MTKINPSDDMQRDARHLHASWRGIRLCTAQLHKDNGYGRRSPWADAWEKAGRLPE